MPTIYGPQRRYVCAHCNVKRKAQEFPCYCYEDIVGLVPNKFSGPEITVEKEGKGQSLAARILADMCVTEEVDPIWDSVWTCACCDVVTIGGERDSHHVSYFPEKIVEVHPYCHSQLTAHKVRADLWPPEGDYEKFYHPPPVRARQGSKAHHKWEQRTSSYSSESSACDLGSGSQALRKIDNIAVGN